MFKYVLNLEFRNETHFNLYEQYIDLLSMFYSESKRDQSKGFSVEDVPQDLKCEVWIFEKNTFQKVFLNKLCANKLIITTPMNLNTKSHLMISNFNQMDIHCQGVSIRKSHIKDPSTEAIKYFKMLQKEVRLNYQEQELEKHRILDYTKDGIPILKIS